MEKEKQSKDSCIETLLSIIGLTFAILFFASHVTSPAYASNAILSWDPPTTNADGTPLTDLAGYNIYYGTTSGSYGLPVTVGNVITYTVTNLLDTQAYYFAVTAYDTIGNESGYSNEVLKAATIVDTVPPVISAVTTGSITSNSVLITWTTDEASTSQIEYGTTASYGSSTTLNSTLVTSHSASLSGLSAWTTYHFRVKSQDAAGNLATSADYSFTTLTPPDTTAPTGTISINSAAAYTNSTTATLTLSCSDASSGCYQMRFSNDNTTWSAWEANATTKTWTLSSGDGTKTVYVQYKDNAGNSSANYSDTISLDTTAPTGTISINSAAAYTNSTTATLTLSCSDASSGCYQMRFSNDNVTWSVWEANATTRAWTLSSSDGTKTVYVQYKDNAGNISVNYMDTISLDTTAPIASAIAAGSITDTAATITWTTNEAATTQINYGTTTSYGSSSTLDTSLLTSHSVPLTGLSPSTTYHYRVLSRDAAGNLATSPDYSFSTSAAPDTTAPTGTISINSAAAYTNSTSVTLTLSCSDAGSGCYQMQFSNDNATWSAWEANAISKTWTLSSGDGTKTVYVQYKDNAGNTSANYTNTIKLDTTAPVTSAIGAGNITDTGATISWTTDESATTQVQYGTNTLYGNFSNQDNSLVISHTVILSGLTANTVYHFRVLSADQTGNQGTSSDYTFTTLQTPQPDTPSAIMDIRIQPGSSTRNSVILNWTATGADGTAGTASSYDLRMSTLKIIEDGITPAQGQVNFSNATKISGLPTPKIAGTPESTQVSQLETNSVYYFAIKAIDDKGNISAISNVINGDKVPPIPATALRQGYTMISFPLVPATSDVQTLLGGILGNPVELYWWSSTGLGDGGTFVTESNIVPGYGYFLKSNIDTATLNITGVAVTDANRTIPLQLGWNMIGNPYPTEVLLRNTYIRKIDTGDLKSYENAVIAGWVSNAIYNYSGSTYEFTLYADAVLKLWQGFWLAVLQNGQYEMIIYKP